MDMKRKSKINILFIAIIFLVLQSCETVSSLSEKIYQGGLDTVDYVGSVFSDESVDVEDSRESDGENKILSASAPEKSQTENKESLKKNNDSEIVSNENLSDSKQILEAVPAEELDVVKLNDENTSPSISDSEEEYRELSSKESNSDPYFTPKRVESNRNLELIIPELKLNDKIQFRIATINFNSGSSQLTYKDIKKIKRVMKLANEKKAKVRIVGHASTRTKDMDLIKHKVANFTISDKRSHAVAKVFIDNKFPVNDLITEAVSDSKPLFHESMPAGTHGNQRTEIYISY
jgi:outer membrane protein OmpA-like peptidoglycan-associated protein